MKQEIEAQNIDSQMPPSTREGVFARQIAKGSDGIDNKNNDTNHWNRGKLFDLGDEKHYRFVNDANAVFTLRATSIASDASETVCGDVLESPSLSLSGADAIFSLSAEHLTIGSMSFARVSSERFDLDARFPAALSAMRHAFPLDHNFRAALSLAPEPLLFVFDRLILATNALFAALNQGNKTRESDDAHESHASSVFCRCISEIRGKYPPGCLEWKTLVRFLASTYFCDEALGNISVYAAFRILEFIERKQLFFHTVRSPSPDSAQQHQQQPRNTITLAVAIAPTTITAAADSTDEQLHRGNKQKRRIMTLDRRLIPSAAQINVHNAQEASVTVAVGHSFFSQRIPAPVRDSLALLGELMFALTNSHLRVVALEITQPREEVFVTADPPTTANPFSSPRIPDFPWSSFLSQPKTAQIDYFLGLYPTAEPWLHKKNRDVDIFAEEKSPAQSSSASSFSRFTSGGCTETPTCSGRGNIGASPAVSGSRFRCFIADDSTLLSSSPFSPLFGGARFFLHEMFHSILTEEEERWKAEMEPTPHSWFERKNWPADFESESGFEEDYFFEAFEKRILVGRTAIFRDKPLLAMEPKKQSRIAPPSLDRIDRIFRSFCLSRDGDTALGFDELLCAALHLFQSERAVSVVHVREACRAFATTAHGMCNIDKFACSLQMFREIVAQIYSTSECSSDDDDE